MLTGCEAWRCKHHALGLLFYPGARTNHSCYEKYDIWCHILSQNLLPSLTTLKRSQCCESVLPGDRPKTSLLSKRSVKRNGPNIANMVKNCCKCLFPVVDFCS